MKLCSIAVFVSTLLVLHTATAVIPGIGLGYIRSSLENANKYRIRDTIPDPEDMKTANPTGMGNADVVPKAKSQGPDALQESVLPEKPFEENSLVSEEMQTDTNGIAAARNPTSTGSIPQTGKTASPTNADYPKRRGDGPVFTNSEFPEVSDEIPPNSSVLQSPTFKKLKMYASLTSVLANISRIPQTVALQIDSVISGLQSTYPSNTNVGAYMMGTRFLLRNPRALKPFDLLDQAGFGRLPDLVSSMPNVFLPMINAMDRLWETIARRSALIAQRFAGAVRGVTEGASRSLAGVNFARGINSYSISVPNLIDLALKGRLASKLDELLAYLQQRFSESGLSNFGSAFGASNPASEVVPAMNDPISAGDSARNRPGYRMRSNPRFSHMKNYYRPSRYFNN